MANFKLIFLYYIRNKFFPFAYLAVCHTICWKFFSSFNFLCIFINEHIFVSQFSGLDTVPLIYLFILISKPYCLGNCSTDINSEIRSYKASTFLQLFSVILAISDYSYFHMNCQILLWVSTKMSAANLTEMQSDQQTHLRRMNTTAIPDLSTHRHDIVFHLFKFHSITFHNVL